MAGKRILYILLASAILCAALCIALAFSVGLFIRDAVPSSASHFVLFAPDPAPAAFTAAGFPPATAAKLSDHGGSREDFFMATLDAKGNILSIQTLPMRPVNNQAIPSLIVFQKETDAATDAAARLMPSNAFGEGYLSPTGNDATAEYPTAQNTDTAAFFVKDPSASPAFIDGTTAERYRMRVDLNQDGQTDMLLSEPVPLLGNSHGIFTVLLAENGGYRDIGQIGAHPMAIALEQNGEHDALHKLWVYLRSDSSSGLLGYYEIRKGKLGELQAIEITLAPDGSALGNRLYEAAFSEPSLLEAEISTTVGESVIWKPPGN